MARALAAVLLGALAMLARAGDEPAHWRPWLQEAHPKSVSAPIAFPDEATLDALRRNPAWLQQWNAHPPSVAWNDVAAELVVKYQQNPLRAARVFAYVHIAIHDALVACAQRGCEPSARPIAMHAAASRMLDFLYPDETRGRLEALGHAAAAAALAAGASRAHATAAWQTGAAVAHDALWRALDDGWDLPRLPQHRPAWKPGVWRAAPPLRIYDPIEPGAARWRTWILKNGAEVEPPPPLQYGTAAYWAEVDEVLAVARALSAEQKRIAEEWNLDLGSVTPPGVWNLHAKKLVLAHRLDAAQAARLFSTLNAAMLDAMVACWHAKYKWWTERPITAIREHRDPDFLSHVITPGFPSYTSGHASTSGAAERVLAAFFPAEAPKLKAMADEAAMSRLYGGIHFRSDNDAGLALGREVGARAVALVRASTAQSAANPVMALE